MDVTDYELFEVPPRWLFLRLEISDGTVGPEPGVEIGESVVCEVAGDVNWHNPVWRHADGSVAEW